MTDNPSCPKCGHYNAMLVHETTKHNLDSTTGETHEASRPNLSERVAQRASRVSGVALDPFLEKDQDYPISSHKHNKVIIVTRKCRDCGFIEKTVA